MSFIDILAILITFAAIFSYLNERYIGLPRTIGLMALSLVFSLGLMALGKMGHFSLAEMAGDMLAKLDFYNTLMHGMLGFLLFCGRCSRWGDRSAIPCPCCRNGRCIPAGIVPGGNGSTASNQGH